MKMERVAKLFKNGRNQAVRLPVEFEFDTARVYLRRDREGNVILSKYPAKPDSWAPLLQMIAQTQVPQDFLTAEDRQQGMATRDPFAGEE
jgi:antitoxin VapB